MLEIDETPESPLYCHNPALLVTFVVLVYVTKDLSNTTRPSRLTLLFELAQYSRVARTFQMINPS